MEIAIDGTQVDRERLGYRTLGFGERLEGIDTHQFELRLGIDEFWRLMQPQFDKFVAENKADDEATDFIDAIPELRHNNYADFEKLFQSSPSDVCRLVGRYLFFEMLELVIGHGDPLRCEFVVNSIREIRCDQHSVFIVGEAYHVARA